MDLFSPAGITAWQARLNRSPRFAQAARSWAGRILLVETAEGGSARSTWAVVDSGRCTEARSGRPEDHDAADYVLAAAPETWLDLVAARTTPATAALTGQLSLRKGSVLALIPHASAAAELLAAAADEAA